ncbi:Wadjet anti-phage system protein JetD domain-containing protein [Brevibacterium renqingii]|uniref:Wadjet anti-phage system protein JetD domain-containing protein n=1 Tax=Brevibacterium renqingii TaxID=2776916 RepID=UPI001AE01EF5|nr:DUF3322 and DUF2220 domain-containing protein [Brevibacterium renqingii]
MNMLSVAEARARARSRLSSSMAAWAAGAVDVVRLEIALRPPTEKQVLADQNAAADWAASWRAVEEKADASALQIDWEDRNWARIGRQRVPIRLRLTTPAEVAAFVGGDTARDWRTLRDRAALIRQRLGADGKGDADRFSAAELGPGADSDPLASAIRSQAKRILSLTDGTFATVIDVVDWLRSHHLGSLRPRQLPIRGVDSKWFEAHRSLVTTLLAGVGHAGAVTVLDAEPRLRLRILDPTVAADMSGLDDISAPISQLSRLPLAPSVVFVFENLESVLAMPTWPGAAAVHGSGYAVDGVARLAWTGRARVIYWGDLDSHGFAILNRLRSHLPEVESVLMDEATLLAHEDLWVPEPKPSSGTFPELTGTEARALARIRAAGDVRLEQERIPWDTVLARLAAAVGQPAPGHLGAGMDGFAGGESRLGEGTGRSDEEPR